MLGNSCYWLVSHSIKNVGDFIPESDWGLGLVHSKGCQWHGTVGISDPLLESKYAQPWWLHSKQKRNHRRRTWGSRARKEFLNLTPEYDPEKAELVGWTFRTTPKIGVDIEVEQSEAGAPSSASIEPHSQHGHAEGGTLFPCLKQVQPGWGWGPGVLEHCVQLPVLLHSCYWHWWRSHLVTKQYVW